MTKVKRREARQKCLSVHESKSELLLLFKEEPDENEHNRRDPERCLPTNLN